MNALPSSSGAWGQLLLMIPLPLAALQTTVESQGHGAPLAQEKLAKLQFVNQLHLCWKSISHIIL